MYWMPKDKKLCNILDRMTKNPGITLDKQTARNFGKHRQIRHLRHKDKIYIGMDRGKNRSILLLNGVSVKKQGKKYFFDGL